MDLERMHPDRVALLSAVKAENRRLNTHCKTDSARPLNGYTSRARNLVLYCSDNQCPMRIVAKILPDRCALITKASYLTHWDNCMSHSPPPDRQEMLANPAFVQAATVVQAGVHQYRQISALVHQFFNARITPQLCSTLCQDLRAICAYAGWAEGFSGVNHLLENFRTLNPGTIYQLARDDTGRFQHVVLVPGQAFFIVQHSARTYFSMDAGFTRHQNWKGQLFILTTTDGNNVNIPIAVGIYGVESEVNYSYFLLTIKSLGNGTMGRMLDRPEVVLCTDRHTSFAPAIKACLPKIQHRYDVFHILQVRVRVCVMCYVVCVIGL